jgi:putative NADH-flavin reductase
MARLTFTVFGASGAAGQAFVSSALARGHAVRAFLRPSTAWSAPSCVQVFRGTFDDLSLLRDAVDGVDAVCSFIGPRPPNTDVFCAAATQAILNAMAVHGVQRFACVTGAMVAASPASVSVPARLVATLFRLARAQVAADRASQEAIVKSSASSWTLFKPPRLHTGPRSASLVIGSGVRVGLVSTLSYSDLAFVILDAVEKGQFTRQSVFVRAAAGLPAAAPSSSVAARLPSRR